MENDTASRYLPETPADARLVAQTLDLPAAAAQLRRLQAAVDAHEGGALYGPSPLLDAAVRRYAARWLPLIAAAADAAPILPPLDVLWAWTLHMLAPRPYHADCKRGYGRLLPRAPLVAAEALRRAEERGRAAWEAAYPDEPWAPPTAAAAAAAAAGGASGGADGAGGGGGGGGGSGGVHYSQFVGGETDGPLIHYNLRGSANRQAQAMWNMARPQVRCCGWWCC